MAMAKARLLKFAGWSYYEQLSKGKYNDLGYWSYKNKLVVVLQKLGTVKQQQQQNITIPCSLSEIMDWLLPPYFVILAEVVEKDKDEMKKYLASKWSSTTE